MGFGSVRRGGAADRTRSTNRVRVRGGKTAPRIRIASGFAGRAPWRVPRDVPLPRSPSIASVGDSDDSALTEAINGLFKASRSIVLAVASFQAVAFATLERLDCFGARCLFGPLGNVPPAEARHVARAEVQALAASTKPNGIRKN